MGSSRQAGCSCLASASPSIIRTGWAEDYVESEAILGCDVLLQILHLDLLSNPQDADEIALQIQSVEVNSQAVSVICSLNLGLNDTLPKGLITLSEFPGVP